MEISKLFFSKETKDKLEKKISPQHKGKLRWERLKEAEANGALQHAKKRVDLGKIVGINDYKTAYSWVSGLIGKGAIIENITGFENGLPVHEYHLGKELGYSSGKGVRKRKKVGPTATKNDVIALRKLGKVRWDELLKKAANGELDACTSRKDVAELGGYSATGEDRRKGYSWVANMIVRGHLIEERIGVTSNGRMVYRYSIGTQPQFELGRFRRSRVKKEKPVEEVIAQIAPTESIITEAPSEPVVLSKPSVVITYGELRVEFNESNADLMKEVIIGLIDKVKE